MESRTRRSNDVAVRLGLRELHGLLLLQNQKAVELGSSLFLVVVPAEVQQADRLGSSFGQNPLHRKERVGLILC